MLCTPLLGQLAFDGSLEHTGTVAFERRLHPFERGNTSIQPRELLLDGGDDTALLGEGGEW